MKDINIEEGDSNVVSTDQNEDDDDEDNDCDEDDNEEEKEIDADADGDEERQSIETEKNKKKFKKSYDIIDPNFVRLRKYCSIFNENFNYGFFKPKKDR